MRDKAGQGDRASLRDGWLESYLVRKIVSRQIATYERWLVRDIADRRKLEVKLPTIWTDGKAEVGEVREETKRSEKIREEKEREERRCMCAKRLESRNSLCFSNDLWLRRVEE